MSTLAPTRTDWLKTQLDDLYRTYDFRERVAHDPIELPMRYQAARDREVAGFLAAVFAYGSVRQFKPVVERILEAAGPHPYIYVKDFSMRPDRRDFPAIRYRFQTERDVRALMYALSRAIKEFGSLKNMFLSFYNNDNVNVRTALSGMMGWFRTVDTGPVTGSSKHTNGYRQLFPVPEDGSACKRGCLFLRWMVRDRDIDFGLWTEIPKHKLVIPLDSHISRVARCLGLTRRKSDGWQTAVEITEALKVLDPEDPLKYDFALCHRGISGRCGPDACEGCDFKEVAHDA